MATLLEFHSHAAIPFQQGRRQSQWSSQYIFSPRLIHTYITHGLIPRSNVVFYHHQHSPTMVLLSHPLSFLHVLSIPFIILGIVNPCAGATSMPSLSFHGLIPAAIL